jgi:hypothetical protein
LGKSWLYRQFELKLMLNGQNGKPIMIHSGLSISTIRKMELFCFGTELGNAIAKRPQYWSQLIVKIRKYTGKLTYAANWDDFDKVPFWKELDYIGIDASAI